MPPDHVDALCHAPSERIVELLRRGGQMVLDARGDWAREMRIASLNSLAIRAFADNPVLTETAERLNLLNLMHWVTATANAPASRVSVPSHEETMVFAREVVWRGGDATALDSYRAAASVALRRWTQVCLDLTSDSAELRALLDFSMQSISAYIDDLVALMTGEMQKAREELNHDANARRTATVAKLLDGVQIERAEAETQLGYALTGPHLAAIVWAASAVEAIDVDAATKILTAAARSPYPLTVTTAAGSRWVWLPVSDLSVADLSDELSRFPEIRVAIGRPGVDLDGFRRSHFDALATQQFLFKMDSVRQAARFDDVQLACLVTGDLERAAEFVTDTLGGLASADVDTLNTLTTWIALKCNTVATAAKLYTHRNTVLRRLAVAEELLPRPLAENLVAVAAALDVLQWKAH
jgi:DNA-binding PucR family transcriptional regulator